MDRMFGVFTDHLEEIDRTLEESSDRWKLSRLAKVDLAILRVAAAELLYMDDIPDSASINEAIELAKRKMDQKNVYFINPAFDR